VRDFGIQALNSIWLTSNYEFNVSGIAVPQSGTTMGIDEKLQKDSVKGLDDCNSGGLFLCFAALGSGDPRYSDLWVSAKAPLLLGEVRFFANY